MIPLLTAVFFASLLGSLHCAGMCGAFLAFAVGADATAGTGRTSGAGAQAAYHGGRLATYVMLGAMSGTIGRVVDIGGKQAGLERVAAVVAGVIMIGFGLACLGRVMGWRVPALPVPGALRSAVSRGSRIAIALPPFRRALVIGMLTTLLPCGWLYAFAVTAAGTASPLRGAATMLVFWAGTLPVMVSLGAGLRSLAGPVGRRLPLAMPLVLVAAGLFTVWWRTGLSVRVDGEHALRMTSDQAAARVRELDHRSMPCCGGEVGSSDPAKGSP